MIAAIIDTCLAAFRMAAAKRDRICSRLDCSWPLTKSSAAPAKIANAAEYSGVKPTRNMPSSSTVNGTRKNSEVTNTSRAAGRSSLATLVSSVWRA